MSVRASRRAAARALRRGAGDLQQKIDKGLKKTKDGVTAAHLYDLTIELDRVH